MLEEIVVTAQKCEQKLSETPLSVTAISARNLETLGATQFLVADCRHLRR